LTWLQVTKNEVDITEWSKLCSKHFLHTDYQEPTEGTFGHFCKLKENAIPILPLWYQPPVKIINSKLEITPDTSLTKENTEIELSEQFNPISITEIKAEQIDVKPTKEELINEKKAYVRKLKSEKYYQNKLKMKKVRKYYEIKKARDRRLNAAIIRTIVSIFDDINQIYINTLD